MYAAFFVLGLFRFSYLGYRYTFYLDDFVQYMLYPSYDEPWQNILAGGAGTLFTRPFAALSDFFVWSKFSDCPGVAVFLITAMYTASALMFFDFFRRSGLAVSPAFLVFYTFMPINTEGTYWLSASSRIAVSLFFTALACRLAADEKKTVRFAVCSAASMCFYEQTAVLALVMTVGICIMMRRPRRVCIPILNMIFLAAFYLILGRMGNNRDRLVFSFWNIPRNFFAEAGEFIRMFGDYGARLTLRGAYRGAQMIFREKTYFYLAAILAAAAAVAAVMRGAAKERGNIRFKIAVGAVLTAVPIAPFLLSDNIWINFRNAVPMMVGAALLFDAAVSCLPRNIAAAVVCSCTVLFLAAAVSEICDYDAAAKRDRMLAEKIAEETASIGEYENATVCYTYDAPFYLTQNLPMRDHIISARGTEWGISGAVRAVSGRKKIVAVPKNRQNFSRFDKTEKMY